MIHDLDLVHTLVTAAVGRSRRRAASPNMAPMPTKSPPSSGFENGTVARLDTSRIAEDRRRGLRAVYADGVVEIDFLSREIINTTPRPLAALEMGDPLGRVGRRLHRRRARRQRRPWSRPSRRAQALSTALLIEEAADASLPAAARARFGRLAVAG